MKAIITTKYGPPESLQYLDVEKPSPKENEVLVKVHAASLNAFDWHLLTADIFVVRLATGLRKPRYPIPGADIAGRVEAVGSRVTQFKPGDEVFGDIAASGCGGFAEYVCARADLLALKPTNATFEQAAALPMAGLTALQGLRDNGHIQPGQKVLIQGAAGGVGTFAVQLAKYFGAHVTAVCSTRNLEQALSLGADAVIDYTRQDFTRNGQQYDLIFAANGYHSILAYQRALTPHGIYVMAGGKSPQLFQAVAFGPILSKSGGRKLGALSTRSNQQDLVFLKEMVEAGKLRSVIDRVFPLAEAAEALRYLGTGHARGKVVLNMLPPDQP